MAHELVKLGERHPETGAFYYNAGCFMSSFGQYSEAIRYFEKAFAREKMPQYIYNVACSALEVKDHKKAHIALALYFSKIVPTSDVDAWYVFCNLTQHLPGYYALKEIVDSTITKIRDNESKINNENYYDLKLLYTAIIYFLRENNKIKEAAQVISLLDNRNQDITKTYSLITSCLESLQQISCSEYEDALKLLYEGIVPPEKKTPTIDAHPQGYISNYNRNRNFGFLRDSSGTEYFFHRSAIVDDVLLSKLNNFARGERIPVVFEMTQGPRGPVAIQISQYRTVDEMFELAVSYADSGDYPRAIAQIKRVLALNPDYSNAKEFYEKWRDYARITGVPRGSNPYARARRVQLIEKDLGRAEQLLREAIARRDSVESAIKDLAQLLVQQGRSQEAIEVLERNRTMIRDQQSVDNLLIGTYQKAEEYDRAISLLRKKLKLAQTRERRAQILWLIANIVKIYSWRSKTAPQKYRLKKFTRLLNQCRRK